jgi:hypothetical protein
MNTTHTPITSFIICFNFIFYGQSIIYVYIYTLKSTHKKSIQFAHLQDMSTKSVQLPLSSGIVSQVFSHEQYENDEPVFSVLIKPRNHDLQHSQPFPIGSTICHPSFLISYSDDVDPRSVVNM